MVDLKVKVCVRLDDEPIIFLANTMVEIGIGNVEADVPSDAGLFGDFLDGFRGGSGRAAIGLCAEGDRSCECRAMQFWLPSVTRRRRAWGR